jgi:hypothetical protein
VLKFLRRAVITSISKSSILATDGSLAGGMIISTTRSFEFDGMAE